MSARAKESVAVEGGRRRWRVTRGGGNGLSCYYQLQALAPKHFVLLHNYIEILVVVGIHYSNAHRSAVYVELSPPDSHNQSYHQTNQTPHTSKHTMARGSEAKSARKQARKEARAKAAEAILNGDENVNDFAQPPTFDDVNNDGGDKDSDDSDDEDVAADNCVPEKTPEKLPEKKKSKSNRAKKAATQRARGEGGAGGGGVPVPKDAGGIKTLPLIMLIMLTGTTVIPALLYAGDWFGEIIQKKHLLGNLGHRLGVGASPKKRVISFYEKHDPEKINEVPTILSKYYGDYPTLVKRLERKYGDYGYFLNWENDEAPMTLAFDKLWETHAELSKQFDRHAPAIVKTGARNMRHNLGFLYKKGKTVWKKQVWPVLQPYLGVPDAKAARQQKLKDKKDANKRKKEATGQRRRSAEFRDEDEM